MRKHEETKREMRARTAKNKKGKKKKVDAKLKVTPMTYEEAANMIPIGAWISRLGEECSELSAAISKYKRALNGEFPCRTSASDAFASVISEAVDVALALDYCTENAFTCGDINMADYQKFLSKKKAKIVRQVMEAEQDFVKQERPQPQVYRPDLYLRAIMHATYGTAGMTPDLNNPMRDAVAEDLYDD